jgi:hypothetical protein
MIRSVFADEVTIIEPVPPFMWTGSEGLGAWLDDLAAAIEAMRMSNARLAAGGCPEGARGRRERLCLPARGILFRN